MATSSAIWRLTAYLFVQSFGVSARWKVDQTIIYRVAIYYLHLRQDLLIDTCAAKGSLGHLHIDHRSPQRGRWAELGERRAKGAVQEANTGSIVPLKKAKE